MNNGMPTGVKGNGHPISPHRDADPIMRLRSHYFDPADFIFERFQKLDKRAKSTTGLNRSAIFERRYSMTYWLSGLYVTIEGMENLPLLDELARRPSDIPELIPYCLEILADVDDHRDSLRLLRNASFHFQRTPEKYIQFFEDGFRLHWAAHIHKGIGRIFSEYRLKCAIICALSDRTDEIDIMGKSALRFRNMSYFNP